MSVKDRKERETVEDSAFKTVIATKQEIPRTL